MASIKFTNFSRDQIKYIDVGFWFILIAIVICSVISIFSASSTLINKSIAAGLGTYRPILSHIGFLIMGLVFAWIVQFLDSWFIRLLGYVGLVISIACLCLMYVPGLGIRANGVVRWIRLGPASFQPSEAAKLSLIIVASDLLGRIKTAQDQKKYFWIVLGLTVLVCIPILPGNLSSVVLIFVVMLLLLFVSPVRLKWVLTTAGIILVCLVSGFFIAKYGFIEKGKEIPKPFARATTWVGRVDDFFANKHGETITVTDDNYQEIMAEIAVARGGQSPVGVLPGNSVMRNKLPLAYMDFIFAIIVEETGIVGAAALMFLYISILGRACIATNKYADYSALLMVMGLALMLTSQALLSMAVAVGAFPVTGQPLPLISKGGTSIVITSIYFGIMMSVCREQRIRAEQDKQVIQESKEDVPTIELDDDIPSSNNDLIE